MSSELKYSLKHVLNKRLKAEMIEDGKVKLFPVYAQLIFKRKNYMFRSIVKTYYQDLSDLRPEDESLMDYEIQLLTNILDFEIEMKGEHFDVPGFSDKYFHYRKSIVGFGEEWLIGKLDAIVRSNKSRFADIFDYKYIPGKFSLLLEAVTSLEPKLNEDEEFLRYSLAPEFWKVYNEVFPESIIEDQVQPTVFDWVSNDHPSIMMKIFDYKKTESNILLFHYLKKFDSDLRSVTINR